MKWQVLVKDNRKYLHILVISILTREHHILKACLPFHVTREIMRNGGIKEWRGKMNNKKGKKLCIFSHCRLTKVLNGPLQTDITRSTPLSTRISSLLVAVNKGVKVKVIIYISCSLSLSLSLSLSQSLQRSNPSLSVFFVFSLL